MADLMRAWFWDDSSFGFMCYRLIGKSEQASTSHISGAKICETKASGANTSSECKLYTPRQKVPRS